MEFKKYKPAIEVQNNGTTNVFGGTLIKGTSTSVTKDASFRHYWKSRASRTDGYVRNASRVLINNKPVTDWIYSTNYLVHTYVLAAHNNNNH